MTKAITVRLDPDLLTFLDSIPGAPNRSDKVRGVLLWLKLYQGSYLDSVKDHIQSCITQDSNEIPERLSQETCEEKIYT
jgi:hypothetical protein